MRYIIIVLLICGTQAAIAQAPGFMGKRFMLFVDGNPTPALFVQNINNTVIVNPGGDDARTDKVNRFAFNIRPQVTAEYLVGHGIAVGLSYSMIMMGTTRAYVQGVEEEDEFNLSTWNNYLYDQDVVKGQGAGIHVKFYSNSKTASIPPIGGYQMLSVYVTQTNTYDTKSSNKKLFKDDFIYPVMSYSVGRQSMILRNVLLKTGVEFGLAFVPRNFFVETEDDWTVQEYAGYNVHQSLAGYYFFNLTIGIGYVAF